MPRLFSFGATAIAILASLAAWHWRNERFAAILKQEHAKTARTVVAAPTVPGTPAVSASAPVAPAKPAEPTGASFREAMQPEATEARRAKDPKLQVLHTRTLRLELLLKNGPFLRGRALSGEARERLLAAWIERELEMLDVRSVSHELGLALSSPAVKTAQQAADKRLEEVETAVLGSEGRTALVEYRRTQPVRDFVGTFFGEAALAGMPVTVEQADAVTAMLIHSRSGRPAGFVNQVDLATVERDLPSVLTAEQIDLLLLPLRERRAMEKLTSTVFAKKTVDVAPGNASR